MLKLLEFLWEEIGILCVLVEYLHNEIEVAPLAHLELSMVNANVLEVDDEQIDDELALELL